MQPLQNKWEQRRTEHRYYMEIAADISFGILLELLIDIFVHVIIFPKEFLLLAEPIS